MEQISSILNLALCLGSDHNPILILIHVDNTVADVLFL